MLQRNDAKPSQVFLQTVRELDLGPIAYQLMHSSTGPQWTEARTIKAIARYLAFLYLVNYYPRLQLVPSADIDCVWHFHILDTQKYARDCQMLFGHFIHHFPYFGVRDQQDQQQRLRAYVFTNVLFQKHFQAKMAIDEREVASADCEPLISGISHDETEQVRPCVALSMPEILQLFGRDRHPLGD